MSFNLTLSSATYDTSGQKFGSAALNGGSGVSPAGAAGSSSAGNFTWECWVKRATAPGGLEVLMGSSNAGYIGIVAGTGVPTFNILTGNIAFNGSVSICDGSWHHVALVGTPSGCVGYVDGVSVATTASTNTYAGTATWNVRCFDSASFVFGGEIDEVALWSIAKYTSGFTPPSSAYSGSESGLIALYHLDSNGNDSAGAGSPATAYTMTGPSTGTVGSASSNFTVTANGSLSSSVTITPSDSSGGGTFTPATVTLSSGVLSATFTYTPASSGAKTISATNGGSLTDPSNLTFTASGSAVSIAPNNAAILYSPYNWNVASGAASSICAGAYFSTLFSGSSIVLNFTITNNSAPVTEIYYRIDGYEAGAPWTKAALAATISPSMPADTSALPYHLIEVMIKSTSETINRWTSPSNTAAVFTGLTLGSGASVVAPKALNKNILIYGDSITEGVRTVNGTATNDTDRNDAMMSGAYRLRDLLGSELSLVGFGGSGLTVSGSGNVPALPSSYNLQYAGQSRSFSPVPDLIIINEGTNDGSATDAAVTAALITVLNDLLTACPNAPIAVMRPFNGSKATAIQAGIAGCNTPALVTYVDTTGYFNTSLGSSDGLHPSGPNNLSQIAPQVANAVRPLLNPRRFDISVTS